MNLNISTKASDEGLYLFTHRYVFLWKKKKREWALGDNRFKHLPAFIWCCFFQYKVIKLHVCRSAAWCFLRKGAVMSTAWLSF